MAILPPNPQSNSDKVYFLEIICLPSVLWYIKRTPKTEPPPQRQLPSPKDDISAKDSVSTKKIAPPLQNQHPTLYWTIHTDFPDQWESTWVIFVMLKNAVYKAALQPLRWGEVNGRGLQGGMAVESGMPARSTAPERIRETKNAKSVQFTHGSHQPWRWQCPEMEWRRVQSHQSSFVTQPPHRHLSRCYTATLTTWSNKE